MAAFGSLSSVGSGNSDPLPVARLMKLIILDRDGVINEDSESFVTTLDQWVPIPGSLEAIAKLTQAGHRIAVATNQSGLGRGLLTVDDLNAMHQRLHSRLAELGGQVEAVFFCPHAPGDGCGCRKPMPGLLFGIRERLGIDFVDVLVIGDSLRDLESAWAAGAAAALVLTGKGARTLAEHPDRLRETPVYADLATAAEAILGS